jgi:DNA-binding beta-propeller fold protein YncE
MPTGEVSSGNQWLVIDAGSGEKLGSLSGGTGPHNTVMGPGGRLVYLGGRNSPYLFVASTSTRQVVRQIGPLQSGVRPFTINSAETLAFTTATGYLGFQMSSLVTGKVLFTVGFRGFAYDPSRYAPSAPSHGISLSPDGRELYVIDGPNSYVHAFAVSGERQAPRPIADIKLVHPLTGDASPCSYDCARDGWLQHSRSGRYVYVGDSGDVIDTKSKRIVAFLPALQQTRKMLEIDWRLGRPVATTERTGVGPVRQ